MGAWRLTLQDVVGRPRSTFLSLPNMLAAGYPGSGTYAAVEPTVGLCWTSLPSGPECPMS